MKFYVLGKEKTVKNIVNDLDERLEFEISSYMSQLDEHKNKDISIIEVKDNIDYNVDVVRFVVESMPQNKLRQIEFDIIFNYYI